VEAVEDPRRDRFVLAVQWHPELGWKEDQLSQSIFKSFVAEAAKGIDEKARIDAIPNLAAAGS
jgi:gamma-glutamyl-gamma-aminobutyrate hydrolase PuuD